MPLEELLTLHRKDEFAAGRDADRRTATSRHVVILLSWSFWTYLTHAGFVARGFGSLFEVPKGAVLAVISVLSLSVGPLSASVILVTLDSGLSGSFLPLLGTFPFSDECWAVLLSGAASHRRPAYPPPKAMEIARRYANKAGI